MARKSNFLRTAIRVSNSIAAEQRRIQNQAIKERNAELRRQKAEERERERQLKVAEREKKLLEKESAINYAENTTTEAQSERDRLTSILKTSLETPFILDFDSKKDNSIFFVTKPRKPKYMVEPTPVDESYYLPKFGLFDYIIPSLKRKKINEANKKLSDMNKCYSDALTSVIKKNEELKQKYEKDNSQWIAEKDNFEKQQMEFNNSIDQLKLEYEKGQNNAVEYYFSELIIQSNFNNYILDFDIQYDSNSAILIIDIEVPGKEIVPDLKNMKYVISRKQFTETKIKTKEVDEIYDEIILQLTLMITNDIYISDIDNFIKSIVVNGIYQGINKSTGNDERKYIVSLQTTKDKFSEINIKNVEAKACFLKFKGISGNKLSEFIPIAPILKLEKEDRRFVEAVEMGENINGMNLAAMQWEEFEHLIRELFEKEFAVNGAEVKITQASRDGGVDAIMFDPDPIRGGKFVIQAKRYTNVVGVSAVRDLYGTIMNEGAVKGILVTTANFGADSHEFAKGKPISLMNGSNLLHMLQKHGYQARIDINEAKKLLSETKK